MLRKSLSVFFMALFLGLVQAEDKVATATAVDSKEEPRRTSETDFQKLKQIDPKIKITKVHEFRNDDAYNSGHNEALKFEQDYWNYGAILKDEKENRKGHYFIITWVNDGPQANFTTRFEYRQTKSKEVVRTLTLDVPNVHGAARSSFAVLGDAFAAYGPVVSWRFTILKGDQVVGEEHSFIW